MAAILMKPIAVVIVNWNSWEYLERCLEALAKQTYKDFSVTIIDNASKDDMPLQLLTIFPHARLVRNINNLGFAAGNNVAINRFTCESEWVALINPDAIPEPCWLDALLHAAKSNVGFDIFGSKLVDATDPTLLDGVGDIYHISGRVWRNAHGTSIRCFSKIQHEIFSPCAAAALYRRVALIGVGGFDEDFFCYVEDVDLGFRLRLAGHKAMLVSDAVVRHVGSASTGGQHSDFSIYHGHRNLVWTYIKNMPGVLFWLCLPLHLALNIFSIFYFSLKGQMRVILRAKWDALKGVPKMWRKRREIQSRRVVSVREIWGLLDKRLIPMRRY